MMAVVQCGTMQLWISASTLGSLQAETKHKYVKTAKGAGRGGREGRGGGRAGGHSPQITQGTG